MSSLGQKFSRKAQVLGKKIESKSRVLGKTENTLKNVIIPGSGVVGTLSGNPQIGMLGYGLGSAALAATKAIRNDIKTVQSVAARLEKINLRKEGEELLNKIKESGENSAFV